MAKEKPDNKPNEPDELIKENAATPAAEPDSPLTDEQQSMNEDLTLQMQEAIGQFMQGAKATAQKVSLFVQEAQKDLKSISSFLLGIAELAKELPQFTEKGFARLEELDRYLTIEIDKALKDYPDDNELSLYWDIMTTSFTEDGELKPDSPYRHIIEAAIAKKDTKQITTIRTDKIDYPLDKPNKKIWDLLANTKFNKQLQLDTITIDTSKGKNHHEAGIIYGIDFDKLAESEPNLSITRQLTQFDKRVYIAAAAIYNAGNEVTTVTQIHKQMGNTKQPTAAQAKKINNSLTKMGGARIYINNTAEAKIYKNYPVFKYDASLLPFERVTASVNGGESETAIHFFREPPLMDFARGRKQITTLDLKLLASPISKTEANLAIDDYLLERISHIKKGKANPKILYETLYKNCKITTPKQKQRAPEKIARYLDHYCKCGFIKDYKPEADGVRIFLTDTD